MDTLKLVGIGALLVLSGLLYFGFVRRAPTTTATATILSKTFQDSSTYVQQPVGTNRGLRTPTNIAIAESYAFDLRVDGMAEPVRASLNSSLSREFEVGQRVNVQLVRRGIPPFWQRTRVVDMTRVDAP